ncbi:MAG: hypothetical protein H0T42_00970 [Deltaproteobacteria bacterium]|nr:hypothetical protein [Deltaproteobacteria bacterium]
MAWWSRASKPIVDGELAVVTGIVRAVGPVLEAPLSGRPAVAYTSVARIGERRIGMQYGIPLLTTVDDRRIVPFDLETPEQTIQIDVTEVELAITPLPLVPRDLERERAFLIEHASGDIDVRTAAFEERCVEPGARIEVRGLVIAVTDPTTGEHGFRDGSSRFRIIASEKHPVRIRSAR